MSTVGKAVATVASSVVLLAPLGLAGPADAAAGFGNCTNMHKVYKHGVAKSKKAAAYQVKKGYGRPAVKPKVYSVNSSMDRDKDGTACEA